MNLLLGVHQEQMHHNNNYFYELIFILKLIFLQIHYQLVFLQVQLEQQKDHYFKMHINFIHRLDYSKLFNHFNILRTYLIIFINYIILQQYFKQLDPIIMCYQRI